MAKNKDKNIGDFTTPLYVNGLQGRMLHLPAPKNKKREILFIYGHHSSLERWWGVIQDLNQYGSVIVPDLPGFGGMESFYKIGEKPTIDNLADYLASFVKLHYRRKKVTIAGLSLGFVIVTRMLQRYPELADKVDMLISVVGFTHKNDFKFSRVRHWCYLHLSQFLSGRIRSRIFRYIVLNRWILGLAYARTHNAKHKFVNKDPLVRRQLMDAEIKLWHSNDVRTHMYTYTEFLVLNNCDRPVKLPVWHIDVKSDNYFDRHIVEQHMRVIFTDVYLYVSELDSHAPSIIADVKTAAPLFPRKLRQALAKPAK